MDRRTKILMALFGTVLLYALVSAVVYPKWIEPLANIDERIAAKQTECDRLEEVEEQVERAKQEYRALAAKIGSFDVTKVATEIRAQINQLLESHQLHAESITPSRATEDRKTKLTTMQITVSAVGTLKSTVEFLKDLAEMRQVIRVGNAAMYPAGGERRNESRDRVSLRVPVEVMVLPQQRIVGRIDEAELVIPEEVAPRHADRDYSLIWRKKPFREPIPLHVDAGRDVAGRQGQTLRLSASAGGGEPPYRYAWSPSNGLGDPTGDRPSFDAAEPGEFTFEVTVTDAEGVTATDSINVSVQESVRRLREPPAPTVEVPQRTPVTVARPWPDARFMQLCMTLMRSSGSGRIEEVMIYNNRVRQAEYYAVGDAFNGGELVFVHPRGGVVRRNDEYFLHPIGMTLDQEIRAVDDAASGYPELKTGAEQHRGRQDVLPPAAGEQAEGQPRDTGGSGPLQAAAAAAPTLDSRPAPGLTTRPPQDVAPAESAGESVVEPEEQAPAQRTTEPKTRRVRRLGSRP